MTWVAFTASKAAKPTESKKKTRLMFDEKAMSGKKGEKGCGLESRGEKESEGIVGLEDPS